MMVLYGWLGSDALLDHPYAGVAQPRQGTELMIPGLQIARTSFRIVGSHTTLLCDARLIVRELCTLPKV
jgi:hypothetical protein